MREFEVAIMMRFFLPFRHRYLILTTIGFNLKILGVKCVDVNSIPVLGSTVQAGEGWGWG